MPDDYDERQFRNRGNAAGAAGPDRRRAGATVNDLVRIVEVFVVGFLAAIVTHLLGIW